ncbi:LppX_LprAFG lipoprotein [Nonomuraea sp. NPDC050556]|uniref:LppX_LprAFG lipoprotein n=1 Tax=Nonomuraea sp. NPDC050556 TaxID=3364369 RepID=UPI00379C3B67
MLKKLLLVLALALMSACSSGGGAAPLPSGPDLVKKTAEAMKTVKTAAFSITTDGKPKVVVRKADGKLTSTGDAEGTITVDLGGLQELQFVLLGDTVHYKGPTGGFKTMTRQQLAMFYDPSVILDPAKGIAQLLTTATDPRVEAEEGGAYKMGLTFNGQTLATMVPGVSQGVTGTVWVDKATSRLTKVNLPLQDGSVTVAFSDYDAEVKITPPPAG